MYVIMWFLSIICMWLPLYVLVCLLPEVDINKKYTIVSFSPSILNKISQNVILTIHPWILC